MYRPEQESRWLHWVVRCGYKVVPWGLIVVSMLALLFRLTGKWNAGAAKFLAPLIGGDQ